MKETNLYGENMEEKSLLKNKNIKTLLLLLLTFFTTCAFCINLKMINGSIDNPLQSILIKIYSSFDGYRLTYIPLFIAFYYLYSKWYFDGSKMNKIVAFLSALISIFMVIGFSIKNTGDLSLIFHSKFQFLISLIVMLGYFTMIYIIIKKLYIWLDTSKFEKLKIKKKIN